MKKYNIDSKGRADHVNCSYYLASDTRVMTRADFELSEPQPELDPITHDCNGCPVHLGQVVSAVHPTKPFGNTLFFADRDDAGGPVLRDIVDTHLTCGMRFDPDTVIHAEWQGWSNDFDFIVTDFFYNVGS